MPLVKVKRNFQITLPSGLRKNFNIAEGDLLAMDIRENGLMLRLVKIIPEADVPLKNSFTETNK